MSSEKFTISNAKYFDSRLIFADIFYDSEHIIRISKIKDIQNLEITFYPIAKHRFIDVKYEAFEKIVNEAKNRILGLAD